VDQIKSQVDQLAELGDDQVAELQSAIISEFDSFETQETTPETVDAMTSLADMLDTVRGELTRREVAAEELASRAAEAAMRVKGEVETMEGEEDAPEGEVVPTEEPVEAEPESDKEEDSEDKPDSEMEMGYGMDKEDKKKKDMKSYSSEEEVAVVADASVPESEAVSEPEETPEPETVTESEEASIVTEEVTEFSSETEEVVSEDAAEIETPEVVADASTEAEVVEEVSVEAELSATEAETTTTQDAQIEQEEQATVTASADEGFQAPADRQPVLQVSEPAKVAITAGADIPGYTAGSEIKGMYEVASAMEKRIHSLRRVNGGDGEQHIVASFTTSYPEERTLSTDAESNAAKIDAVVGREAIVASGGHAAPFEVKYDIFAQGSTTDRPVRDALPKFQADRGGIRFVTPPSFAAGTYADAVGIWTAANDSAQTPNPASKTSLTVAAAAENTVSTDAVTLQLQFGNLMSRAYPELISRHNELALVQHAREAEDNLLAKIEAGSTAVSTSSLIGFGRDFLVQLRRAATAYRSRHRIAPDTVLKAIIPAWVYDAMAADLALAMPGDGTLAVSKGEIDGYLATINVDLVPTLDGTVFGAQGAAALVEFPDTFKWYLFSEGTFLFLDGGTLDLGIIRDSSLVGTNDYKMFIETFENVAKVGIESLAITSAISVNGVAAALRDTTGGATAAAIEL
jgi:chemotaxis protein histidine kinase CheA